MEESLVLYLLFVFIDVWGLSILCKKSVCLNKEVGLDYEIQRRKNSEAPYREHLVREEDSLL